MTTTCRNFGLCFITELEVSTKMFGKLADPNGANNALSQVLYGLALRYDIHPSSLVYCISNKSGTDGDAPKTQNKRYRTSQLQHQIRHR